MESLAGGAFPGSGLAALALGAGLLGVALLLFVLLLLSRRQQRRDVREISAAVEALRSGRGARPADVDPGSPFAHLAEAVNRLGQEVGVRLSEAEGAGEGLRAVVEAVRDVAVLTTDADGDIRSANTAATALLGWGEEEIQARPLEMLFDEAAWREILPKLARRSLRERGLETRSVLRKRDGGTLHADVSVRLLRGRGGEASGFLLLARDADARVRAEEALRESEERHRELVEGLADGVFVARGGRIEYANAALGAFAGRAPGDLVGTPFRDRVATRDVLAVHEHLADLEGAAPGTRRDLRVTLLDAGGAPAVRALLRLTAVSREGRRAVLGTVSDETARRGIEEELRRTEARLDAIVEASADAMLVLAEGPSGAVVRLTNQAFLDLFGLAEASVLGAAAGRVIELLRARGGGAERVAGLLEMSGRGAYRESVVLGEEGGRTLDLLLSPLIERSGAVLGRVLACRDASRQTARERELRERAAELAAARETAERAARKIETEREEVEARAAETERLNSELKALDQMKSNLLANVTHELQTPIVSIRGYTEMILKERLGSINAEQRKGLSLSLRNIDRLISMIDNLMAFARMEQDSADLRLTVFPLRAVVEESVETVRARLEAKKIRVAVALEEPEVPVHADRERVLQVFLNLLSNAVKFNREGGEVRIESRRGQAGLVAVRVQDTGIGIPEEDLERIFDRYYQVGGVGQGRDGSGLGLSIVRNILRLHGCTIRAESQVGRGAAFLFALPLVEAGVERGAPRPAPAEEARPPAPEERPAERWDRREGDRTRAEEAQGAARPRFRIIRRS